MKLIYKNIYNIILLSFFLSCKTIKPSSDNNETIRSTKREEYISKILNIKIGGEQIYDKIQLESMILEDLEDIIKKDSLINKIKKGPKNEKLSNEKLKEYYKLKYDKLKNKVQAEKLIYYDRIGIIYCENPDHKSDESHPEKPERINYTKKELTKKFPEIPIIPMNNYTKEEVTKFINTAFSNEHLQQIESGLNNLQESRSVYSTGENSLKAVFDEVRCIMTLCDKIINDELDYAYAIIRPPGHHCYNEFPAGFCLINNAILAATKLLQKYNKINILDVDLHHGGGTQKMMENNQNISFASIHNKYVWSDGFYPKGINEISNEGRIINIALPGQSNDKEYIYATDFIFDKIQNKDIWIASMGFDAHKDETKVGGTLNERMNLTSSFYGQLISNLINKGAKKVFVVLEGGYNKEAIADSSGKILEAFEGKQNFEIDKSPIRNEVHEIIENLE